VGEAKGDLDLAGDDALVRGILVRARVFEGEVVVGTFVRFTEERNRVFEGESTCTGQLVVVTVGVVLLDGAALGVLVADRSLHPGKGERRIAL
jgi:hypothetical protein